MKILNLYCAALLMIFSVSACTTENTPIVFEQEQPIIVSREDAESLPVDFSILEIGRELSDGSVDIYDPWLMAFVVPDIDRSVVDPFAIFPSHPFMVVKDPDVRVYSLNSSRNADVMDVSSFSNVLNEVSSQPEKIQPHLPVQLPVQLIEQEPLLP